MEDRLLNSPCQTGVRASRLDLRATNDQHRLRRNPNNAFGNATQKKPVKPVAAMCTDDDQVGWSSLRFFADCLAYPLQQRIDHNIFRLELDARSLKLLSARTFSPASRMTYYMRIWEMERRSMNKPAFHRQHERLAGTDCSFVSLTASFRAKLDVSLPSTAPRMCLYIRFPINTSSHLDCVGPMSPRLDFAPTSVVAAVSRQRFSRIDARCGQELIAINYQPAGCGMH